MRARLLAPGRAEGRAMVLAEPLSLWGGLDPATGVVVDPHHARRGASLAGRVVVMPAARGSSSSSSVLAEAVRAGVAPAGLLLAEPDLILAIGAAVAEELYGVAVPVGVLPADALATIADGARVAIHRDGRIEVGEAL